MVLHIYQQQLQLWDVIHGFLDQLKRTKSQNILAIIQTKCLVKIGKIDLKNFGLKILMG